MSIPNPFRYGTGIFPTYFAGRDREKRLFESRITLAIESNNIQHMAIYGDWGIGKTSLIKYLSDFAKERGCIPIRVTFYKKTWLPTEFVTFLLRQFRFSIPEGALKKFLTIVKKLKLPLVDVDIEKIKSLEQLDPQITLVQTLSKAWDDLKSSAISPPLIVFFLDDVQLASTEETLYILRNTFMELLDIECKYMLVVTGTSDLFSMFDDMAAPLTRFFNPTELKRLSVEDARDAIIKPLEQSSIKFSDDVVDKILEISEGHPYYIQLLCYYLYDNAMNNVVDMNIYNSSFYLALNDMAQRMFDRIYNSASDSARQILGILAKLDKSLSYSEILNESENIGLKKGSVGKLLERLKEKEIVKQIESGEDKGKYLLFDKFFKEYVRLEKLPTF